jgi:hypothetical protein
MTNQCVKKYVLKLCIDCDEEYEVLSTAASKSQRCKACAKARDAQREAEYCERKREATAQRGPSTHKFDAPYLMVKDPDQSWGFRTRLCWVEIRYLLMAGYLKEGTVFFHKKKKIEYVVGRVNGAFDLIPTPSPCAEKGEIIACYGV